jgi:hypothetical protein
MAINLIKLGVGVADIKEMAELQQKRYMDYHGQTAFPVWTRRKPVRDKELLNGGSLYRVIKNKIQCRQRILGLEIVEDEELGKHCLIMVDPEIIETVKQPHRPFQGWRYYESAKAPKDMGVFDPNAPEQNIPAELEEDLRASGLL